MLLERHLSLKIKKQKKNSEVSFQVWCRRGRVCPYRGCGCSYAEMIAVGLYVLMVGRNETASRRNGGEDVPIAPLSHSFTRMLGKGSF